MHKLCTVQGGKRVRVMCWPPFIGSYLHILLVYISTVLQPYLSILQQIYPNCSLHTLFFMKSDFRTYIQNRNFEYQPLN